MCIYTAPPPAAAALFLGASPKKDDVSSKGSKGSKTGRKSGTIEKDVKKQSEMSATQVEGSLGTSADDIPEVVAGEDQVGNETGSSISSITRGQAFENVDEKVDHQDTTHEDKQDDVEKEKKQADEEAMKQKERQEQEELQKVEELQKAKKLASRWNHKKGTTIQKAAT